MKSPEGRLMCYIGSKRANWYVQRNLAVYNNDKEIQLLFHPNGLGHYFDKARNIPVQNICVVCGCSKIEFLSKHHSVPECFRKHFPEKWKSYRSHEILFLCIKCHQTYEVEAQKIKYKMIADYGGEELLKEYTRIRGYIKTLLKYGNELPDDKKLNLQIDIMIYYSLDDINDDILKKCLQEPKNNPYKLCAQNVTNHYEFNRFWKQHFVEMMKPKHLPAYWSAEYEPATDNNKRNRKNN
jgi:hypothetical protein